MRHTVMMIFALLSMCATRSATASMLLYEGFDYPAAAQLNGQINPSTGDAWTRPATPAGNSATATIKNDNLTYPGLEDSTGLSFGLPRTTQSNLSKIAVPGAPYNPNTATKSVFFSFLMEMTEWVTITDAVAATQTHRDGDFIAGFTSIVGGGGTTNMSGANVYAGQVRIRRELVAGAQTQRYQLGFHKNNSGGAGNWAPTYDTTQSFGVGETVLVVGEYQFNTTANNDDIVRMWLNPTPGQLAGTPDIVSSFGMDVHLTPSLNQASITSFWFRDGNTFLPGPTLVDELRIGTTYKSVTPAPEPNTLMLASLSVLFVGIGRRRAER